MMSVTSDKTGIYGHLEIYGPVHLEYGPVKKCSVVGLLDASLLEKVVHCFISHLCDDILVVKRKRHGVVLSIF